MPLAEDMVGMVHMLMVHWIKKFYGSQSHMQTGWIYINETEFSMRL